ncbi:uncharacterized protein LOC135370512 [Ornithodoros turicata]|uniref:uncharacterized protein LOC135370512 n=1 Tax=Ornithodoros turicata TaxID=34597 RepID=UPI003139AC02
MKIWFLEHHLEAIWPTMVFSPVLKMMMIVCSRRALCFTSKMRLSRHHQAMNQFVWYQMKMITGYHHQTVSIVIDPVSMSDLNCKYLLDDHRVPPPDSEYSYRSRYHA